MMAGSNPKISCMGIIGDGCGGGREFIVENETLVVYDPYTKESRTLLEGIKNVKSISKRRCIITIECEKETIELDLSQISDN